MLLFLLLIVIVAVLLVRGQMKRQHREFLSAVNPERLKELDEIARWKNRQTVITLAIIVPVIILGSLLTYSCQQQPKKPSVTYHEYPAKPLSAQ